MFHLLSKSLVYFRQALAIRQKDIIGYTSEKESASRAAAVFTTTPATLAWVMSMALSAALSTLAVVAAPAPSEFLQAET